MDWLRLNVYAGVMIWTGVLIAQTPPTVLQEPCFLTLQKIRISSATLYVLQLSVPHTIIEGLLKGENEGRVRQLLAAHRWVTTSPPQFWKTLEGQVFKHSFLLDLGDWQFVPGETREQHLATTRAARIGGFERARAKLVDAMVAEGMPEYMRSDLLNWYLTAKDAPRAGNEYGTKGMYFENFVESLGMGELARMSKIISEAKPESFTNRKVSRTRRRLGRGTVNQRLRRNPAFVRDLQIEIGSRFLDFDQKFDEFTNWIRIDEDPPTMEQMVDRYFTDFVKKIPSLRDEEVDIFRKYLLSQGGWIRNKKFRAEGLRKLVAGWLFGRIVHFEKFERTLQREQAEERLAGRPVGHRLTGITLEPEKIIPTRPARKDQKNGKDKKPEPDAESKTLIVVEPSKLTPQELDALFFNHRVDVKTHENFLQAFKLAERRLQKNSVQRVRVLIGEVLVNSSTHFGNGKLKGLQGITDIVQFNPLKSHTLRVFFGWDGKRYRILLLRSNPKTGVQGQNKLIIGLDKKRREQRAKGALDPLPGD